MEMNRPAVNPTGNDESNRGPVCSLLDELVAMRWDLSKGLRDNPDLPVFLTAQLMRVGEELNVTIDAMKALIRDHGLPL